MRIAITGSSGFVGTALCQRLRERGDTLFRLVRSPPPGGDKELYLWRAEGGDPLPRNLHAVINLAGSSIATRWSQRQQAIIRDSRIKTTHALVAAMQTAEESPPPLLISASAVGYYGNTHDNEVDESSPCGEGFLATLCKEWEAAAAPATQFGTRTVIMRLGVALDPSGGMLHRLLFPFRLGVGGRLGSGAQWMSWITLDDLVRGLLFAIDNPLRGAYNLVAPMPLTNKLFTTSLAEALHRPALLPLPKWAIHLFMGQMGKELLLASSRVVPSRLTAADFRFLTPSLPAHWPTLLGRH